MTTLGNTAPYPLTLSQDTYPPPSHMTRLGNTQPLIPSPSRRTPIPLSHDKVGKHKVELALEVIAALGVLCGGLGADTNAHLNGHLDHESGVGQQALTEAAAR